MPLILDAATTALTTVWLIPLDLPNPAPVQPPGTEGFVTILGWLKWVGLALSIVGLIVVGSMLWINHRRGEGGEHAGRIGMILVGVILIGAATALVGFLSGA